MRKGFTLIEILVVIAIIGIVIGLFLPNYNEFRKKSRDQARKADVRAIAQALELYKLNSNPPAYPITGPSGNSLGITPGETWDDGVTTVYMSQFPKDPLYSSIPTDYFYRYVQGATPLQYYVGACLEDGDDAEARTSPHIAFDNDFCDSDMWYYKVEP